KPQRRGGHYAHSGLHALIPKIIADGLRMEPGWGASTRRHAASRHRVTPSSSDPLRPVVHRKRARAEADVHLVVATIRGRKLVRGKQSAIHLDGGDSSTYPIGVPHDDVVGAGSVTDRRLETRPRRWDARVDD